jgi:anti-sigma factor RsiW
MNCRSVQQQLSAYVDRELAGREMLEIRSHLSACSRCAAEEEDIRTLKSLLAGVPTVEPLPGFEQRLRVGIAQDLQSRHRGIRWPVFSAVAALSAAATLLVLQLTTPRNSFESRPAGNFAQQPTSISRQIQVDQASFMSHDPLSGGQVVFATNNERN